MWRFVGVLCWSAVGCIPEAPADLAILDVAVVDVTDGTVHPGQTVLVRGSRIAAVGPSAGISVPAGVEVVVGEGGYLVPGFWDTHVHSAASTAWHFPLFLAYGITSVRNMHSTVDDPLALVASVKRRLASGDLLGPRFLANGGIVDGDPPVWPGSMVVRDGKEAREAVDRLAEEGADFIKVYDRLTERSYLAILERARERGIPVDGHVPFLVGPEKAAAAGQRTVEHTSGITLGCSSRIDSLRSEYLRYLEVVSDMLPYPDATMAFFALVRRASDTREPQLCVETVRAYLEQGVAVVPTLVTSAASDARAFLEDPEGMSRLPRSVREDWSAMAAGNDPVGAILAPVASVVVENVRMLHGAGVVILAGTDVGNPFQVPGLSLHRELQRLENSGLSPLQALQAATLLPARVFAMEDSLGTVETGKLADLVLLEANPLDDIENSRRIRAVLVDGRLFDRAALDCLLAEAAGLSEG